MNETSRHRDTLDELKRICTLKVVGGVVEKIDKSKAVEKDRDLLGKGVPHSHATMGQAYHLGFWGHKFVDNHAAISTARQASFRAGRDFDSLGVP